MLFYLILEDTSPECEESFLEEIETSFKESDKKVKSIKQCKIYLAIHFLLFGHLAS